MIRVMRRRLCLEQVRVTPSFEDDYEMISDGVSHLGREQKCSGEEGSEGDGDIF